MSRKFVQRILAYKFSEIPPGGAEGQISALFPVEPTSRPNLCKVFLGSYVQYRQTKPFVKYS